MPKDKEKMTKEEKIEKATELIEDLEALELSDEDFKKVAGGRHGENHALLEEIKMRQKIYGEYVRTQIDTDKIEKCPQQ